LVFCLFDCPPVLIATYVYDKAGNRTLEQVDKAVAKGTFNSSNQLVSRTGAGPMVFEGCVNEPSTVTVGGNPATVDANQRFRGTATVTLGQQSVEIKATDLNGNVTTNHVQVTVAAGTLDKTLSYDPNGNLLNDGARTFTWDAENRLLGVTSGGQTYTWTYNGFGQRVTESVNGTLTRRFVSDGATIKRELNTGGTDPLPSHSGGVSGISKLLMRR
jgi:YD repeat-containing protein